MLVSEVGTGLRRIATTDADVRIGAKQLEDSRNTLRGAYLRRFDLFHEGGVKVEGWGMRLRSQRDVVQDRTKPP